MPPLASPLRLAFPLQQHQPAGMKEEPEPLRVVVVDDEPLIRWSVAETLSERGDLVTEAQSGEAAIRALANVRGRVDVVLLDYQLPDCHDLGLLSTVRRLAPLSAVILMSACCTPETARDALALGAYRVVSKPIDMGDLPALVHAAAASRPESRAW
jgi:DNA-binding NtrC family response regulator